MWIVANSRRIYVIHVPNGKFIEFDILISLLISFEANKIETFNYKWKPIPNNVWLLIAYKF